MERETHKLGLADIFKAKDSHLIEAAKYKQRLSLSELALKVRNSPNTLALVLSIMDDNDFSMLWDSIRFTTRTNNSTM